MWTEENGLWIRPPATRTSRESTVGPAAPPVLKAVWLKGLSGTHLRSPRCLLACVLAQHECFGHLARRREPRAQLEEARRRFNGLQAVLARLGQQSGAAPLQGPGFLAA